MNKKGNKGLLQLPKLLVLVSIAPRTKNCVSTVLARWVDDRNDFACSDQRVLWVEFGMDR